jgi:WhiB family redox-sensing transcriptional regulator
MARDHWLWMAACRDEDTSLFFPAAGDDTATAMAICTSCLVQDACLSYAVGRPELMGIWGGTSEKARKRMRRPSVRAV